MQTDAAESVVIPFIYGFAVVADAKEVWFLTKKYWDRVERETTHQAILFKIRFAMPSHRSLFEFLKLWVSLAWRRDFLPNKKFRQ